jgi:hypothetical protein
VRNCNKPWHSYAQLQGNLREQTKHGSIRNALMGTSAMTTNGIGRQLKRHPIPQVISAQGLPRGLDGANLVA